MYKFAAGALYPVYNEKIKEGPPLRVAEKEGKEVKRCSWKGTYVV
jgi:hypothetical protein